MPAGAGVASGSQADQVRRHAEDDKITGKEPRCGECIVKNGCDKVF